MTVATDTWPWISVNSTAAIYRTWGLRVAALWAAAGLVQTSDTGQVNWATVLAPGTNNRNAYEIWRFSDPSQATAPIFIRVDYGTGTSSGTEGAILLTMGMGTDGAGNITNTIAPVTGVINGASAVAGQLTRLSVVYRDGYLFIMQIANTAGTPVINYARATVRSIDADATPNNKGVMVFNGLSNTGNISTYNIVSGIPTSVGVAYNTQYSTLIPGNVNSVADGTDTQYFIHWMMPNRVSAVPSILTLQAGAVTQLTTFSAIPLAGITKTFIALDALGSTGYATNTNYRLAFEYQ